MKSVNCFFDCRNDFSKNCKSYTFVANIMSLICWNLVSRRPKNQMSHFGTMNETWYRTETETDANNVMEVVTWCNTFIFTKQQICPLQLIQNFNAQVSWRHPMVAILDTIETKAAIFFSRIIKEWIYENIWRERRSECYQRHGKHSVSDSNKWVFPSSLLRVVNQNQWQLLQLLRLLQFSSSSFFLLVAKHSFTFFIHFIHWTLNKDKVIKNRFYLFIYLFFESSILKLCNQIIFILR